MNDQIPEANASENSGFDFNSIKSEFINSIQDIGEREVYQKNLDVVKDVKGLMNSFVHAQKAMGSKVSLPNESASTEEWKQIYRKLGAPEKAEDYDLNVPEFKFEEKVEQEIRKTLHEQGLSKKQAKEVVSKFAGLSQQAQQALVDLDKTEKAQIKEQRTKLFNNLETAETAVDTLLKQQVNDPEKYKAIKSLVDNNNEVFELLYGVYENTAPKDIGKAQGTMAAKESPEETVGRILSDKAILDDYYRNNGRNMPSSLLNQLKEAMSKADPKEVHKHIRYGK
jgi:hypothetical protein